MSLVDHAKEELERAGLTGKDSDYDGWPAECVLELMRCFAAQGHSGSSAEYTLDLFQRLAKFQVLTPISSDPSEWIDRTEISGKPFWQNRRDSRCFSEDGGKTWTRLEE